MLFDRSGRKRAVAAIEDDRSARTAGVDQVQDDDEEEGSESESAAKAKAKAEAKAKAKAKDKATPVVRFEKTRSQYIAWTGIKGTGQHAAFKHTNAKGQAKAHKEEMKWCGLA